MSSARRLLSYFAPYKFKIVVAIGCMVAVAALNLVVPWIVKEMIDKILINKDTAMLNVIAIIVVVVYVVRGGFFFGQEYLMASVGQEIILKIRNEIYEHLHRLSLSFFVREHTGEIVSRVVNDVYVLQDVITRGFIDLVLKGITVVGIIAFIFYIDWRLSLITLAVLPLAAFAIDFYSKKLRHIGKDMQERLADLSALIHEVIAGIRIVKSFGMESTEIDRFKERNRRNYASILKGVKVSAILSPLVELIMACSLTLLLWYGGHEVINGRLTPGELVAFLGYVGLISAPIKGLSSLYSRIQQAMAAADRIFEVIDTPEEVKELPDAKVLDSIEGRITFEGVWFSYDEENFILKDINLDVKPGEVVAIVGPTGVGKTTLADLVPRFYDPQMGTVRIDGVDLKEVNIRSLRRHIGIVPQDPVLFSGTIRDNIAYGYPDATDEEVQEAARIANAHLFINRFPDGYDTIVGERGASLSGGERQRIAIARAIIRKPKILILDEATSFLDYASESLVSEAISKIMEGRTSLVIAHRLSTIVGADKIVVLKDGRIVEIGKHAELLSRKGEYYELYQEQLRKLSA